MIKFATLLFVAVTLASCKTIEQNQVAGNYIHSFKHEGFQKIKFTKDNKFHFIHSIGLLFVESEGEWTIEGNKLILNSYESNKSDYFEVEEKVIEGQGYIQVVDDNNYAFPGSFILINGNKELEVTDDDGKIYWDDLKISNLENVKIRYMGISNGFYKVKDKKTNCLIIKLFPENRDKIYFKNQKVVIDHGYIKLNKNKFLKK
jgi:hypothetical protein